MKIVLGTAKFGMKYGVFENGNFSQKKINNILKLAKSQNINIIDTSPDYGNSHYKIGKCNIKNLHIITKLPKVTVKKSRIKKDIRDRVLEYIRVLNCDKIHYLLLHNPVDLLSQNGKEIYNAIVCLKEEGLIDKIGVSTYDLDQLNSIINNFEINLVQHPLNLLDRRIISSGMIDKLNSLNVEVHCRSVFLQGLLLTDINRLSNRLDTYKKDILEVQNFCKKINKPVYEVCLRFVLSIEGISKIIIGVDNLEQLKNIIKIVFKKECFEIPEFKVSNKKIMDPRVW